MGSSSLPSLADSTMKSSLTNGIPLFWAAVTLVVGLATSSSVVMRYCTALVTLPATEPPLSLMSLTKSARFIDSVPEMQNATPAKMAPPFLAAGAAFLASSLAGAAFLAGGAASGSDSAFRLVPAALAGAAAAFLAGGAGAGGAPSSTE